MRRHLRYALGEGSDQAERLMAGMSSGDTIATIWEEDLCPEWILDAIDERATIWHAPTDDPRDLAVVYAIDDDDTRSGPPAEIREAIFRVAAGSPRETHLLSLDPTGDADELTLACVGFRLVLSIRRERQIQSLSEKPFDLHECAEARP